MARPRVLPTVRESADGRAAPFYVYAYPHGRRRKFTFTERESAEAFAADVTRLGGDRAASRYALHRSASRVEVRTLAEYAIDYALSRPVAATRQSYSQQARYLAEFDVTGRADVRTLDTADLEAYLAFLRQRPNGRGGTLGPSTVRMAWILARNVLDRLVRQGILSHNPARSVEDQPRAPRKGTDGLVGRAISEPQYLAIAERLPAHVRTLTDVLWGTGLRVGEALALRWADVVPTADPGTVELFVQHSLTLEGDTVVTMGSRTWTLGPTKSKRPRRVGLLAHRLDALDRGEPGEFLFTWSREHYQHAWRKARTEASAGGTRGVERVRLHDLRHSYVTDLLRQGTSPHLVAEAVGHASAAFTMDRYAHAIPSDVMRLAR